MALRAQCRHRQFPGALLDVQLVAPQTLNVRTIFNLGSTSVRVSSTTSPPGKTSVTTTVPLGVYAFKGQHEFWLGVTVPDSVSTMRDSRLAHTCRLRQDEVWGWEQGFVV